MNDVLHVNLDALNEAFVHDLKKQFGPAEVEISIRKKPETWLTEEQFWQIIGLLDWSKRNDREAITKPAADALAAMPTVYQNVSGNRCRC